MNDKKLEFSVDEEWLEYLRKNLWASYIPEFAKDSNGNEFMRVKGRSVAYKVVSEDEQGRQKYECAECGQTILSAKVAHTIRDGLFRLSGSGEVHYESVPYCPKCEEEPNFYGSPIYPK